MCVCVCAYVRTCLHACVRVCAPLRLIITSGLIWTTYYWLNKFYSFYVSAVVGTVSRCGFRIDVHHENQSNKCKLALYKLSIHFISSLNGCT